MTERPTGPHFTPTFTNAKAERVKQVRALAGRSARSKTGRMLVEGPQAVREAVRFAPGRVRDLFMTEDSATRYSEIVADAEAAEMYLHIGTPAVLEAMSPDGQGVVAVLDNAGISLDDALAADTPPRLVVVLSNVRDPGNAGTAIRVADAAGADAVVLAGESVDPSNPKVIRASAGSLFHVPVVRSLPLDDALAALAEAGMQIVAADGSGSAELGDGDAGDAFLAKPTAWVFGNEAWGLREEELALVDSVVRIPIYGKAESLNLATAASVCLYASARAQR
ncbi:TrmH family RNA methyltransferase [Demequina aurantiaca]|uniref:TrmH family RNA methyltransferase n=1 Tax=Demequina aurantiaca TaxID=676200 RepID=UPI00078505DA|nr:RNA methyltransferase [Demequina aurantiaca]